MLYGVSLARSPSLLLAEDICRVPFFIAGITILQSPPVALNTLEERKKRPDRHVIEPTDFYPDPAIAVVSIPSFLCRVGLQVIETIKKSAYIAVPR